MDISKPQVLVVGDPAVDWFMVPFQGADRGPNWSLYDGARHYALPGGALLTEHLARQALTDQAVVVKTPLSEPLQKIDPAKMVHSTVRLQSQESGGDGPMFAVQSYGYAGPDVAPGLLEIPMLESAPRIVVVDDGGNGFRHDEQGVRRLADLIEDETLVVLKTTRPLFEGPLFDAMLEHGAKSGNLVVVVSADDMRMVEGVKISQGLSWERTARETLFALRRNPQLGRFDKCPHVVVRFGLDGALLISRRGQPENTLYFHNHQLEGHLHRGNRWVVGMAASFVASLAHTLVSSGVERIRDAVGRGLECALQYSLTGYCVGESGLTDPPKIEVARKAPATFGRCDVPEVPREYLNVLSDPDPDQWRIADSQTAGNCSLVAEQIVRVGPEKAPGLGGVPTPQYGDLVLVDRTEIEAYSAVRRLIEEYLLTDTAIPLCLGVFGPPGSGKSFGVKQIIKSLESSKIGVVPTFNVAQFLSYGDLTAALHKVRDEVLAGHCPVVFFDEFDSEFGARPLGWLKYFLAPMADGKFREGDSTYHTGKAIFVFAGGTRSSFAKFERNEPDDVAGAKPLAAGSAEAVLEFREAKGPDFASRLRGFVDVMGPNRRDLSDDAHILRRALLLHSLLRRQAKRIFDGGGKRARMDEGLIRAFLHVGDYNHGARSLSAILAMSSLAEAKKFVLASLPARQQLEMHVDAEEFMWLAAKERFASMLSRRDFEAVTDRALEYVRSHADLKAAGERLEASSRVDRERALVMWIAFEINEHYGARRQAEGRPDWATPFAQLTADLIRSNEDAAEDIPARLRDIGHGLHLAENPRPLELSSDQGERLAEREHLRFNGERRLAGWRWASTKSPENKESPYLIDWAELNDKFAEIADFDRQGVVDGFAILNKLGMEAFPLTDGDGAEVPEASAGGAIFPAV